jgi:hypothetical protein
VKLTPRLVRRLDRPLEHDLGFLVDSGNGQGWVLGWYHLAFTLGPVLLARVRGPSHHAFSLRPALLARGLGLAVAEALEVCRQGCC